MCALTLQFNQNSRKQLRFYSRILSSYKSAPFRCQAFTLYTYDADNYMDYIIMFHRSYQIVCSFINFQELFTDPNISELNDDLIRS